MKKKKILIFGLPGSGKTTLSKKVSERLKALHLNADEIRKRFNDWDFSNEGRLRQAERMNNLAKNASEDFIVLDFVCPTKRFRAMIAADTTIFMDTILSSRFADTNKIFEMPDETENITFRIKEMNSDHEAKKITTTLMNVDLSRQAGLDTISKSISLGAEILSPHNIISKAKIISGNP
ncbi:AAA family ATPase [Candidatus Puniceispirillum sp.]|nr:AAA family ATPase [Candidatus Puniceispirillum sp.]